MPIYEFECPKCRVSFEYVVMGEEEVRCPQCGGKVEKLISTFRSRTTSERGGSSSCSCSTCSGGDCSSCR